MCTVDVALQCTESDLKAIKQSAKLIARLPAEKQVKIFHALIDDIKASREDLAVALETETRKLTPTDAKGAKLFFKYWCTICRLYPKVVPLKIYVEADFQICSEMAPAWYENAPIFTSSLLK